MMSRSGTTASRHPLAFVQDRICRSRAGFCRVQLSHSSRRRDCQTTILPDLVLLSLVFGVQTTELLGLLGWLLLWLLLGVLLLLLGWRLLLRGVTVVTVTTKGCQWRILRCAMTPTTITITTPLTVRSVRVVHCENPPKGRYYDIIIRVERERTARSSLCHHSPRNFWLAFWMARCTF